MHGGTDTEASGARSAGDTARPSRRNATPLRKLEESGGTSTVRAGKPGEVGSTDRNMDLPTLKRLSVSHQLTESIVFGFHLLLEDNAQDVVSITAIADAEHTAWLRSAGLHIKCTTKNLCWMIIFVRSCRGSVQRHSVTPQP